MSLQIAVVHEAAADFQTATELADRAMCAAISWLDEELLGYERTWLDQSGRGKPLTWKGIKQLALEAGITAWGHFANEPALPDAAAARRAIVFLRNEYPELRAIVLVRDRDDQPERRGGLEQARRDNRTHVIIVVVDPRFQSDELTASKNDQAKRSPKRVLAALTGGDHDRERRCWRETPLGTLRDRGKHNGLADYLEEVERRLVPLISGHNTHDSSSI